MNKALKLDPSNVELVTQKKLLLKEAISNTKDKLDALKQAQAQADQLMKDGVEVSQEEYRKLQREIVFTEDRLKNYRTELVETQINLSKVAESTQKVGEGVENMGKKLMGVTTAISAVGIASAKLASDYEDSIAKVSTIADTSEVSLKDISNAIMELSNQTGIASTEIADNVYEAISAGQKTGDAVDFVSQATTLAKAGFAETADALDILTTIMNAYGLEASEVGNVSDILIQTQNLGKTTVAELAGAMGKIIPTANANGVALDQLASAYAVMTSNGIATAETTTYLNSMLNELGKSGTIASDAFRAGTEGIKEGGLSFAEAMASGMTLTEALQILKDQASETGVSLADMFGSAEAGKAGQVLLNNADNVDSALEGMRNSTGATQSAFEKLDTTSYQVSITVNQLKNTMITLGQTIITMLAPTIDKVSAKVSEFSKWFGSLNDSQKKMIVTIGAVIASIAPILIIVGKLIIGLSNLMFAIESLAPIIATIKVAFGAFNAVLLANPIILIVAGIVALIAGLVLLYNNCEWFRDGVNAVWEAVKTGVVTAFNAVIEFFTVTIPNAFTAFVDSVKAIFTGITDFIANNWQALLMLLNPATLLAGIFTLVYDNCEVFRNFVDGFVQSIKDFFTNAWTSIVSFFTTTIPSFIASVVTWFQELPYNIGFMIGTIIGNFIQFGINLWTWASEAIPNFINTIVTFFSELPGKIFEWLVGVIVNIMIWREQMITSAIEIGTQFIENLITFITTLPGRILEWLTVVITNIIAWKDQMVANAIAIGTSFVTSLITLISELPGKIWTWLVNAVTKIVTWRNDLVAKGKEAMSSMITSIVETAQSIPGKMSEIGKNIVEGVWNGIQNAKDAFVSNVEGFFSGIVDGVKSALGIHSPSTVFADEVGEWIPPGVSQGINKTAGVVKSSIASMIAGAISSAQSAMSNLSNIGATLGVTAIPIVGGGGGSETHNTSVVNNVTINAESVDRENIDEICDEVNRKLGLAY
ncbi:MAG: phage tail tape measure protein [Parabacteroides sp.]|nr:phage tail tape measure protein [Parabacteroides sp.]